MYIGNNNHFYADDKIVIGTGTVISDGCTFRTANHYYDGDDLRSLPYDDRVICRPIVIGRNCWIGMGVIILPGVVIGEGAVIGAGSVITKNIPNEAIVAGNPAILIKYRNHDVYQKLANDDKQIMQVFDSYKRNKIYKGVKRKWLM